MSVQNSNNAYLRFGSTQLQGYWTEQLNFEETADTEDTSAGAGRTHIAREPKLVDNKMDFLVIYDDVTIAQYVQTLRAGVKDTLIWGPEGNASGKPRFEGSMILTSTKYTQSVDKKKHSFTLSFVQGDTPVATISGGDTFA